MSGLKNLLECNLRKGHNLKPANFPIKSSELKWLKSCTLLGEIFSTCSRRKYFAVILAENGRISGVGYNGALPNLKHCVDGGCPRAFTDVEHGSNYDNCVAVHAEANALLWSDRNMRQNGTLIINGPPCYSCAKLIATSGIKKVLCLKDEKYKNFEQVEELFQQAGIILGVIDEI